MPLKDKILDALKKYENEKPRSQQVRLGPSELGGCREYVRNIMIGAPMQKSDEWATAAVVGTLMGAHFEAVCEKYMDAVTEVPVTTTLPSGLKVSGHADVVLVDENAVIDAKSKDGLDATLREGSSLENLVQISVYAVGLVQAGILSAGCTAHLIYMDRAGNQQFLHEKELTWDEILYYIEVCEDRLADVLAVQEQVDGGNVEAARNLRDKTPPFCYSPKVMCPFRDLCWKGSEWVPDNIISDPDVLAAVAGYDAARAESKAAEAIKAEHRKSLVGVSGVTPDGLAVTWSGSEDRPALYVTRVKS